MLLESERGRRPDLHAERARHSRNRRRPAWAAIVGEAEMMPLFGRLSSGEQDRVFAPSTAAQDYCRDEHRRNFADHPGSALCHRYRAGSHQPLQPADAHETAAHRAGFAEQRQAASGPQRAAWRRRLHPALFGRRFPRAAEGYPAGDPASESGGSDSEDESVAAGRDGNVSLSSIRRSRRPSRAAISCCRNWARWMRAAPDRAGPDLARLPVDPSIGRMILQSHRREGALTKC